MKTINLTQGKVALVDDEDFEELNKYKWFAFKNGNTFYALRSAKTINKKRKVIYMHRVLANTPDGMNTDHKDRDGLNNQKSNLRACTYAENCRNKLKAPNNTSGYKGVHFHKASQKWTAYLRVDKKAISFGYFDSKEMAHQAYVEGVKKHHKEFANY